MFFFQYMLFAFVFMVLALVSLQYKKIGLVLHIALGAFAVYFFNGANFTVLGLMIVIPFALLGVLYYFGNPSPKKWAYRLGHSYTADHHGCHIDPTRYQNIQTHR